MDFDLASLENDLRRLAGRCVCCGYAIGGFIMGLLATWVI